MFHPLEQMNAAEIRSVEFADPLVDEVPPVARAVADIFIHDIEREYWYKQLFQCAGGKMFGVLVVRAGDRIGYLAAFSGMLAGQWVQPGFVPPLFDKTDFNRELNDGEQLISEMSLNIDTLAKSDKRRQLMQRLDLLHSRQYLDMSAHQLIMHNRKLERQDERSLMSPNTTELDRQSQSDRRTTQLLKRHWKQKINALEECIVEIDNELESVRNARASFSHALQRKLFRHYQLLNVRKEKKAVTELFAPNLPPGGTGDCAAPKLLQFAHNHDLTPVALAEFWMGTSPPAGIRHHGHFYSPCRSKCAVILPYMLQGLTSVSDPIPSCQPLECSIEFEDEQILIVNKPAGLLSTPGKQIKDSVYARVQTLRPAALGPLLVHRLDMDTSGIMLIAKDKDTHKKLQRQFINRTIEKRYIAIVERRPTTDHGTIELPLRVDLEDRPRQLVCLQYGKKAITRYRVVGHNQTRSRICFQPVTGRTHQIRVHAAHQLGLNSPIVGDRLYGVAGRRMLLHAESLTFTHPKTTERLTVSITAPF